MPVWTYTCSQNIDSVVNARVFMEQARADPWVIESRVSYSEGEWTFRVDTGDNPRTASDTLWEFLRTHSNEEMERASETLTHQPLIGFDHIFPRTDRPNQNGDIFPEAREQIINQYLAHPEGRMVLGRSMIAPLRERRDYQTVARRAFLVDQLPEGATPIYTSEPTVTIPPWLVEGIWIRALNNAYAQVAQVSQELVTYRHWRTNFIKEESLSCFLGNTWQPCEEPKEGRPWWERIDADDFT